MIPNLQVLSQSVVGATAEDAQFDEEIDSQPPAAGEGATAANKYEVIGTLTDPQGAEPPAWVSEVVQVRIIQGW